VSVLLLSFVLSDPSRLVGRPMLTSPRTDPDSPRVKRMIKDFYEEFEMPDDDTEFFGGNRGNAGIYVRKTNATSHL
jgi:hypothetical protein